MRRGLKLIAAGIGAALIALPALAQTPTVAYTSMRIVQPVNDTTVFNNSGNVDVTIALAPDLRAAAGDRVALSLDGRDAGVFAETHFRLAAVERGEHVLVARVIDGSGNTLVESLPVSFHMWRASRLFPNRHGR